MTKQFDAYSETYDQIVDQSIAFMGGEHAFFTRAKANWLIQQLQHIYGDTRSLDVLDVGCGVGKTDSFLCNSFNSLSGVDVSIPCIEKARQDNPQVDYRSYDGISLPYADQRFDVAFMVCVLHHVDRPARAALVKEVSRVLKPGGAVFVFEHNPLNPLTRLVVSRCVFDRGVSLLRKREAAGLLKDAGLRDIDAQYILYVPFELRGLEFPACFRRWLPFGAQFFAVGLK